MPHVQLDNLNDYSDCVFISSNRASFKRSALEASTPLLNIVTNAA